MVVGVARGHNKVVLLNEQQQNGERWIVLEDPGADGFFEGGPATGRDREQVFGGSGVSYLSGRLSPTGRFAAYILYYGGQQINASVYDMGRGGNVTQGTVVNLPLPTLPPFPQGTSTQPILRWIDVDEEGTGSGEVAVLGEAVAAGGTPNGSPYWFIVHYRVGSDDRFGTSDDITTLTMFPRQYSDFVDGLSLRGGVVVLSGSIAAATPAVLYNRFYSCRLP